VTTYCTGIDQLKNIQTTASARHVMEFGVKLLGEIIRLVCLFLARQPPVCHGLLIHEVSRLHSTMHHSGWDSSGRVISSSQRPLLDNTQHSQQTDIHAPVGIRTHNLSRRAAADLRLRPRGHWDQRSLGKPWKRWRE